MKVIQIGLSGKMCSGKSTVAQYLVEHHGFVEMCFASKLKGIHKDLFNNQGKDRETLQLVGERMRQVDPDVWVRYIYRRIPINTDVVISDVRYQNEARTLKEAGFILIRLNIEPKIQRQRVQKLYGKLHDAAYEHISETDLDDYTEWDYVLDGGMPKDKLLQAIDDIIEILGEEDDS